MMRGDALWRHNYRRGMARALLRVLTGRFGKVDAAMERRIRSCSAEQIDELSDRLWFVPSLDHLFPQDWHTPTG